MVRPSNPCKFASFFPIVILSGSRYAGKTTLVKELFKDYHYINLENLDILELAKEDPLILA